VQPGQRLLVGVVDPLPHGGHHVREIRVHAIALCVGVRVAATSSPQPPNVGGGLVGPLRETSSSTREQTALGTITMPSFGVAATVAATVT
jgi:hypothetical protein